MEWRTQKIKTANDYGNKVMDDIQQTQWEPWFYYHMIPEQHKQKQQQRQQKWKQQQEQRTDVTKNRKMLKWSSKQ